MPDPIAIKTLLDELSSTGGGSLVKTVSRSEITSSGKILVIGLGGMGCKTINAAKGVYLKDFKDTGRIQFLAVDTAQGDMNDLNVQRGGNLTLDETFPIYDSTADNLLIDRPPLVEAWLSPDIPREKIMGDGAKQRRAVGRVMLCATPKYEALKSQISTKITNLNVNDNEILQVVIVAGISGGTGSGTFIDVSYMVRMLLDDLHESNAINSRMFGVFYTPDVQKSIPQIGGKPEVWANLQRNGYAALKELDYFMNIGDQGRVDDVYSVRTLSRTYTSHQRVFERSHVYIVSPTTTCHRCEDIIETTAISLMDLVRQGATTDAASPQSLISELSNAAAQGATWGNQNVGNRADDTLPLDACGVKNTLFPAFMNYNFSAFGARSIYFPRNEMVAYCANEAFLEVYNKWNEAFNYTQETVCAAAGSCGIGNADDIYQFVKAQMNISSDKFRIKPGEANYPIRKGFELAGKVINTADTITEATERATRKINEITKIMCDTAIKAIADSIISRFDNQQFLSTSGPVAAMVLLSGNRGHFKGFIQLLEDYAQNIALAINAKQEALNRAVNALKAGQQTLDADKTPHDSEIEVFVDLCQRYSEAYFEHTFYSRFLTYIISGIRTRLNDFNTETFEIYVPIIDSVMKMLSMDAAAFVKSTLETEGNRSTYSLNAFDLNDARRQNNLFSTLFEGYIDRKKVDLVKAEFVASLFDPDRKAMWQNIASNPNALANEIRKIFSTITDDLVSQMLEKLMIMVYGNRRDIININNGNTQVTIDDINAIWADDALRTNALRSAAQNIVQTLTGSLMLKYEVDPTTVEKFSKKAVVILLNETPNLNDAIIAELSNKFGDTGYSVSYIGDDSVCEYKTCITMAMASTFIPLAMVSNISNYAKEYFKAEQGVDGRAGRHLDEVTERWQDNLPEIFGMDTEAYYIDRGRRDLVIPDDCRLTDESGIKNQDIRMYAVIRDAVDYGIKYGYIRSEGGKYNLLMLTDTSAEFLTQIEDRLLAMKLHNPDAKWTDALHDIEAELHTSKSKTVLLEADILNDGLKAKQTAVPESDYDLKNIYRLVRSDMRKVKLVLNTKKFFVDTDFFYNMDNLAALRGYVEVFIKALKVGALSYDKQSGWYCKYSDNQYDRPILFFDDYMRKNEQLDVPFKWYLVFSAFVKNALNNPVVIEGIKDKFDEIEGDRTGTKVAWEGLATDKSDETEKTTADKYHEWDYIIDDIKAAMNSEILRIRDPKIRNAQIEPFYLNSSYKDYYCFPKKYTCPDTLIYNFNKVVEELEYCKLHMNL